MTVKTLDRRVIRTRKALQTALIELIREQGFDGLTIEHITERADLRRATFYLHYGTKEELLIASLSSIFDELIRDSKPNDHGDLLGGKTKLDAFLVTFRHVEQYRDLYCAIFESASAARVMSRIRDYLAGLTLQALQTLPPDQLHVPADVLANYIAASELALVAWWIESESAYSADQMATMAHQLVLNGALSVIPVGEK